MKIVAQPIDVIATFGRKEPVPYKFKYSQESGERVEVRIDKIITIENMRIAGIETLIYTCQSQIGSELRLYQLKYIIGQYRWELYKI
jgi:hypothetical protein